MRTFYPSEPALTLERAVRTRALVDRPALPKPAPNGFSTALEQPSKRRHHKDDRRRDECERELACVSGRPGGLAEREVGKRHEPQQRHPGTRQRNRDDEQEEVVHP